MKLFYSPGSPYARMVRVALAELRLVADCEIVTLRDPASALLPYNPVGRVPTLRLDDGTVLTETLLILTYLDTRHDGAKLLVRDGSDGWAGMARLGTAFGMTDGIGVWNRELRRPEHERSPSMIEVDFVRTNRVMDVLEQEIAAGGWSGPLDAAAIALGCALGYCERRHRVWPWRAGRPALSAWHDRIAERSSFQTTLPPEG